MFSVEVANGIISLARSHWREFQERIRRCARYSKHAKPLSPSSAARRRQVTNRFKGFVGALESLEPRLTLSYDTAQLLTEVFNSPNPEIDHIHQELRDSLDRISEARLFSMIAYRTGLDPTKVRDQGAISDICPSDVPPGSSLPERLIQTYRFENSKLVVELFENPNAQSVPMQVSIDGGPVVFADRIALSRVLPNGDFQYFIVTGDGFTRLTPPTQQFGASIGLGPMTTTPISTGETTLRGQITTVSIISAALPSLTIGFAAGGSAQLKFAELSTERVRLDVRVQHADPNRLYLISSNPTTSERAPDPCDRNDQQPRDNLADVDAIWVDVGGPGGVFQARHPRQMPDMIENVRRLALGKDLRSEHNPLDPTVVVMLGGNLPTDGFGDAFLDEAEAGQPSAGVQRRFRLHGSRVGGAEETLWLQKDDTLTGLLKPGIRGKAIAFIRGSNGEHVSAHIDAVFAGKPISFTLPPTGNAGYVPEGGPWDDFTTVYSSTPIDITTDSVDYLLRTMDGSFEADVVGLLFLGAPLNPLDVNRDGYISPLDALLIINRLNSEGAGQLPVRSALDTSDDAIVSPIDALLVINFLNEQPMGGSAAGEFSPDFATASTQRQLRAGVEAVDTALQELVLPQDADYGLSSRYSRLATPRRAPTFR